MSPSARVDCGSGVVLEREVPLRMRDGTLLVSSHYYPPDGGKQPTLLMRQPYGRDIASTVVYAHPVWFARHGYNVVIQDVRGRGQSEGSFYPFRHEANDGFDTIAALRERPESNGKVGMYGFSYQGMTQWLAAAEQPEGLLCIAPAQTAHDLYRGWFYQNGALRLASSLGWGLQMLKEDARRLGLNESSARLERAWSNLAAQYLVTPYGCHDAIRGEGLPGYVADWFEHDTPGKYWTGLDVSTKLHAIKVPALHLSGWYDTYLSGSILGFDAARSGAAAGVQDLQYLVAGPWAHIPWGNTIGAHSFGPDANLDTDALHLRWFNHWLKGTGEFTREPRIRHFALNQNQWHSSQGWGSSRACFYLHSDGRANSSKGNGRLSALCPLDPQPPDIFVYDPEVPVLAPGGLANTPGPANQAALERGNNVLVYTSEPLLKPLHVFGVANVELLAMTSAPSVDIVAKLILLKPGGEAIFLSIGILRAQSQPDEICAWNFHLDATSCLFCEGDAIRLEIASSAYPLFDRNPSNKIPARMASPWNWKRSTQTLFHDKDHSSRLILPVLEASA